TSTTAAATGAHADDNHGSALTAPPRTRQPPHAGTACSGRERHASAKSRKKAAAISGSIDTAVNITGAERKIAAQAIVAASREPVNASTHRHMNAAVITANATNTQTTLW